MCNGAQDLVRIVLRHIARSLTHQVLICALLVFGIVADAYAQTDALSKAEELIRNRNYDAAISSLTRSLERDPSNAHAAALLAGAHHWKQDFANAKRWYAHAARLDTKYRLDILPLLEELTEWNEIVRLAEPEFGAGSKSPSLLGSLWVAFNHLGRASDADRVLFQPGLIGVLQKEALLEG